jgi:hypothetical protein
MNILLQSSIVGLLTFIFGSVLYYIKNKEINTYLFIMFFVIGFVIHYLIDIIGFNKWYCNKTCQMVMNYL